MKSFILFLLTYSLVLTGHELELTNDVQLLSSLLCSDLDVQHLNTALNTETAQTKSDSFYHIIKQIKEEGRLIFLEDGSCWLIGWRYRGTASKWKPQERLKISHHPEYSNYIKLENTTRKEEAWGVVEALPQKQCSPFILRVCNSVFEPNGISKLILNDGSIFKGPRVLWKVRNLIFILHTDTEGRFELWNLSMRQGVGSCAYVGNENEGSGESLLNIEKRLNQHVLGQSDVIKRVSSTLFNCWAGLNNPQAPLGVFLFLGPSGVGKTELAKLLTQELYQSSKHLIRFDMSQFPTLYDYTRLIGSPPGYVNHDQGGQLTEALKAEPRSVVLLDEIEKAHFSIRKAFLPAFDEGYIADCKNYKVPCNRIIFIMTGNLCSEKIAQLFHEGYSSEEILKIIEPDLIAMLSPEFYNRTRPLVFRPLTPELMEGLVNQKIGFLTNQLKRLKGISLAVDPTAKEYLIAHGFHPTLGARPLERLIQETLVTVLSYAIIREAIPEGSQITLSYSAEDDAWRVIWNH